MEQLRRLPATKILPGMELLNLLELCELGLWSHSLSLMVLYGPCLPVGSVTKSRTDRRHAFGRELTTISNLTSSFLVPGKV
jgi:hypothetical protein